MKNVSYDNLDTEFYIERAYELRRLYVAAALKSLVVRVKAFFTASRGTTVLQGNPAH